jgi:hypothetical protein
MLHLWGTPVSLQTEAVRPEVPRLARRPAFHSVTEARKPVVGRRHHDNDLCTQGRDIARHEQRIGTGGYRLCEICESYDRQGR